MFTVATRRSKEGLAVIYQSIKFVNGVWALAELTFQQGNSNIKVSYLFNNLTRWRFQFLSYSLKYFRLCNLISFIRRFFKNVDYHHRDSIQPSIKRHARENHQESSHSSNQKGVGQHRCPRRVAVGTVHFV